MQQRLPVNNFEFIKDTSQFNEDFIKKYNEESDEGYFLEVDVQSLEKLHEFHNDYNFYHKELRMKKPKTFQLIYVIKLNMLYIKEI